MEKIYIFFDENGFDLISDKGLLSGNKDKIVGIIKEKTILDNIPRKFRCPREAILEKLEYYCSLNKIIFSDDADNIRIDFNYSIIEERNIRKRFIYNMEKDKQQENFKEFIFQCINLNKNIDFLENNLEKYDLIRSAIKSNEFLYNLLESDFRKIENFITSFDSEIFKKYLSSNISKDEKKYYYFLSTNSHYFKDYLINNSEIYRSYYIDFLKIRGCEEGGFELFETHIKNIKILFALLRAIGFYDEFMNQFSNFLQCRVKEE